MVGQEGKSPAMLCKSHIGQGVAWSESELHPSDSVHFSTVLSGTIYGLLQNDRLFRKLHAFEVRARKAVGKLNEVSLRWLR